MRRFLLKIPGATSLQRQLSNLRFRSSAKYWERRYRTGGTSGRGSYGEMAAYKGDFLDSFLRENRIGSVIEFGCGDGNQLQLIKYPTYIGLDVSRKAIEMVSERFKSDSTKSFYLYDPFSPQSPVKHLSADCALSLDVIYHLVEDAVFEIYMNDLFAAARRFVVIYLSNHEEPPRGHMRHRRFSDFADANWKSFDLVQQLPNKYASKSLAEFFVYRRTKPDQAS